MNLVDFLLSRQCPRRCRPEILPALLMISVRMACAAQEPQHPPIPPELQEAENTINIRADSQAKEQDIYRLRGNVEVTFNEMKVTADEATYDDSTGEIVAKGHVTLTDPSAHLEADEAHYNVRSEKGWFSNVRGYIKAKIHPRSRVRASEGPIHVRAKRVERLNADTYEVKNARLTSCESEEKGWSIETRSARLKVGDKLVARGADFRLLRVPVFFAPVLVRSVSDNPRQTGFLLPHIGHSSQKGFILGEGIFWAINPSADLLLGLENFSVRGLGGIGRFRARPTPKSEFQIDYFGVNDRGGGPFRKFRTPGQTVQAVGQGRDLLGGFRGVVDADYISSLAFRQTFTDNFTKAVTSEVHQTGFLSKTFDAYSVNFYVSRYQNFLCAQSELTGPSPSLAPNCPFTAGRDSISLWHSPSIVVSGMDKQVGHSPFHFSFEGSAAEVGRSEPGFETPRLSERLDFHPQALLRSKPFWGFHITPTVGLRATRYGTSLGKDRDPLHRLLGEFSVDFRPPSFEKVFDRTIKGRRFKHVIEPEVRYRLVRSFDSDTLPEVVRFDDIDIFAETNEIEYSLTNTVLGRRDAPDDKGERQPARELFSWRLSQKYYFDPTFGGALLPGRTSVLDPTISLTGFAFAQGRRLSPVVSVLKFAPFSDYDTELSINFSPSGSGVLNAGITSHVRHGPFGLALTDFFINRVSAFSTAPGTNTLSSTTPSLLPSFNLMRTVATYGDVNRKGLSAAFGLDYNFAQRIAHQVVSQVSYNFGCFGIDFEFRRFELGDLRRENQFRIALSLANIGTFGNLKPRERLY